MGSKRNKQNKWTSIFKISKTFNTNNIQWKPKIWNRKSGSNRRRHRWTVFATGVTVSEAIKAQENLKQKGINIRVVDVHTIKPIDKETIIKCAKETKKIISIEDHNIIGGLGSAISEVLTDEYPCKLIRLGIKDTFGKSGKAEELMKYFGITADDIEEIL